jgi:hypothetical protein
MISAGDTQCVVGRLKLAMYRGSVHNMKCWRSLFGGTGVIAVDRGGDNWHLRSEDLFL